MNQLNQLPHQPVSAKTLLQAVAVFAICITFVSLNSVLAKSDRKATPMHELSNSLTGDIVRSNESYRSNRVLERFRSGSIFSDCPNCPDMVVIPAGEFTQGSPASEEEREGNEGPQRRVSVPSFALGQYEVTFDQWDACVASSGCSHCPDDEGWGRGLRPVINVSWDDVQQYVVWLNGQVEGSPYRLPSESEWEHAARAGTSTAYPWGSKIGSGNANCVECQDGYEYTAPVGSFSAKGFGLHDMHGNVWEWVQDCWNGNYSGAPTNGSARQQGSCGRSVLRGGSWINKGRSLRSGNRNEKRRVNRNNIYGFRIARTLTSQ